jgi:putative acetyltransferase
MEIRIDDLQGAAIQDLLQAHLNAMYEHSPPESVHALDLVALCHPSITFWTAWENEELMGCGALKRLSADHAELKSMRTVDAHLRKGVARALLRHILSVARAKGVQRISLETGTVAAFSPAQKLYASEGFVVCEPFADYVLDPYSMFMTKVLTNENPCYKSPN